MRTILLDGDILAFQIASACETPRRWSGGVWTLDADENEGFQRIDRSIKSMLETLEADKMSIALTDVDNYRKDILPT